MKKKKSSEKKEKKTSKKTKKKIVKKTENKTKKSKKESKTKTLKLLTYTEIAMDFGIKVYKKFGDLVKAVVLFGSVEKKEIHRNSDIDIIIILDDASVKWDLDIINVYREDLDLLLKANPYQGNLHINTIKLTTWWEDLMRGDPVVLNVLRHGMPIVDHAGFFMPLKHLLNQGKIKGTPEAIYQCMQRAPKHLARSKSAELGAVEGVYWTMVDSAHGALISKGSFPPSPEHVGQELKEAFVDKGMLKMKYVLWYNEIYELHKKIDHREIWNLKGVEIDMWQQRAEEFMEVMISLVNKIVNSKS